MIGYIMTNYYQVLGIEPSASEAEIKQAFRRKAIQSHPDRGGSHEAMARVNEAWYILADGARRKRHDDALRHANDASKQQAAQQDTARAKAQADQYPADAKDLDDWMDRLSKRYSAAGYGAVSSGPGMLLPTAGTSVRGWVLIILGGIAGFWVGSVPLLDFIATLEHSSVITVIIIGLPVVLGAWLGMFLHLILGGLEHQAAETHSKATQPSESMIIRCKECSSKLRIPKTTKQITVTCPTCKCRFDHP